MSQAVMSIESAMRRAFAHVIDQGDEDTIRFIEHVGTFLFVGNKERELVIDRQAVLQGLLHTGRQSLRNPGNAALWMMEWAVDQTAPPEKSSKAMAYHGIPNLTFGTQRFTQVQILEAARKGYQVRFSEAVEKLVLAKVSGMSNLIGNRRARLSHFAMAFAYPDAIKAWGYCWFNFNEADLTNLREFLVKRLVRRPGKLGDVNDWLSLLKARPVDSPVQPLTPFSILTEADELSPSPAKIKGETETPEEAPVSEEAPLSEEVPVEPQPEPDKPAPPPPPPPPPDETTPIHDDDPAEIDALNREGFANVLCDRIVIARGLARSGRKESDQAFMVHLHGSWGAGKSSVLNFMRKRFERHWLAQYATRSSDEPVYREWLVVDFNAWKFQRLTPPWWTILVQVEKAAEQAAPHPPERFMLKLRWLWMRYRLRTVSTAWASIVALLLFGCALYFGVISFSIEKKSVAERITTSIGSLVALFGGIGGLMAIGRSVVSSADAATKLHGEMADDPYEPVIARFQKLIEGIKKPVIVFIDDLDRCDATYVTALLESIQTMLRTAPITYLIAADRKWICASFGKRYADFAGNTPDPGRPVGYQFLDKLFQISVNLPRLPATRQQEFWSSLLQSGQAPLPSPAVRAEIREKAIEVVESVKTHEDERAVFAQAALKADPLLEEEVRAQLAQRMTSKEEEKRTAHRLEPYGALIEANPRAMKRLVNAVNMNRARMRLERRDAISFEALTRWTMLELRWPLLAEWLAERPSRIGTNHRDDDSAHDKAMRALLKGNAVIGKAGDAFPLGRLDQTVVRAITE